MMGDKIHPTHFQVPEMPYKKREKEAVAVLKKIILIFDNDVSYKLTKIAKILDDNIELVEWIKKNELG